MRAAAWGEDGGWRGEWTERDRLARTALTPQRNSDLVDDPKETVVERTVLDVQPDVGSEQTGDSLGHVEGNAVGAVGGLGEGPE